MDYVVPGLWDFPRFGILQRTVLESIFFHNPNVKVRLGGRGWASLPRGQPRASGNSVGLWGECEHKEDARTYMGVVQPQVANKLNVGSY